MKKRTNLGQLLILPLFLLFALPSYSFNAVDRNFSFDSFAEKESDVLKAVNPFTYDPISIVSYMHQMEAYESLNLYDLGLSFNAFETGIRGLQRLTETGAVQRNDLISIVDFSQPSYNKRLYVIDLQNHQLLFQTYVAHGRNTGTDKAVDFSNKTSSYKSSLGFYITAETYRGKHGYSLKLEGLEKGINDNARRRAIVIHGANYVSERHISNLGYLGRSQGCPAVPNNLHKPLIDQIKDGSCLFIYHPSQSYLTGSPLLN
jgi:hypothetical protein